MSLIQPPRYEQLDDDQRAFWDELVETRGPRVLDDAGCLTGPIGVWVLAPEVGKRAAAMASATRSPSALDERSKELAIITIVGRWQAEFPWLAHAQFARDQGVPDETIEAIAEGREPPLASERDQVVYAAARALITSGRIDDPTLDACRRILGERATVELIVVCGFYTIVSFTTNAASVCFPEGAALRWQTGRA